jgi:ferredoxin-NADP reductase
VIAASNTLNPPPKANPMTPFTTKLRARHQVAHDTLAFHFDKPAGFAFQPGQAIDLVLPDPSGGDALISRHAFSIVSAPFENELVIATRMRNSAFKRALGAVPVGASVAVEGPFGSLSLHTERARPAVLIAGGIGITPFVSMLRQAAHDQRALRLVLLYSNRRPEDAAFLAELQALERQHRDMRLIATMTAMSRSSEPWTGQRGPIDEALLRRTIAELIRPTCYVVGPPAMAQALRLALNEAGVAEDDIRSEEFYGY